MSACLDVARLDRAEACSSIRRETRRRNWVPESPKEFLHESPLVENESCFATIAWPSSACRSHKEDGRNRVASWAAGHRTRHTAKLAPPNAGWTVQNSY